MQKIINFFLILILLMVNSYAYVSHDLMGLASIPTARVYSEGEFRVETGTNIGSDSTTKQIFIRGFAGADMAFMNRLKVGISVMQEKQLCANFNCYLLANKEGTFVLSVGAQSVNGFDVGYPTGVTSAVYSDITSPYAVGSMEVLRGLRLHVGFGAGKYRIPGSFSDITQGLFGGIEFSAFGGKLMAEYDGRDVNMGIDFLLFNNLSLTVIANGILDDMNIKKSPSIAYNYSTKPMVYIGIGIKNNFWDTKIRKVEDELNVLREDVKKGTEDVNNDFKNFTDDMSKQIADFKTETQKNITETEKSFNDRLKKIAEMIEKIEVDLRKKNNLTEDIEDRLSKVSSQVHEMRYTILEEKAKRTAAGVDKNEFIPETLLFTQETDERSKKALRYMYDGLICYYARKYTEAVDMFKKAVAIEPNLAIAHTFLGSVYYELGLKSEAIAEWEISLKINPEDQDVRDAIKKAKGE